MKNTYYVVFCVVALYYINVRVSDSYPIWNTCGGEKSLYIQCRDFLASGWYHQSSFTCGYVRNAMDEVSYDLYHDEEGWKFVQWTGDFGNQTKNTLAITNESLSHRLLTEPSNLVIQNITSTDTSQFTPEKQQPPSDPCYLSQQYTMDSNSSDFNDSGYPEADFKIYYPKRCGCRKVVLQHPQWVFEFDRLDLHENLSICENLKDYIGILPQKYQNILNISSVGMEYDGNASSISFGDSKDDELWIPEFYVTPECQVIYYHPYFEQWHVDFGNTCSPASTKLDLFVSVNSNPCVEYLPPRGNQCWLGFRRLSYNDHVEDEHFPVICNAQYEIEEENDLSIFCTEFQ